MGQWLCGVLRLVSDGDIDDIHRLFMSAGCIEVIIIYELNKHGVGHYHVLVSTLQRSDRFRRTLLAKADSLVFDCVKWGTCRVWRAMHAYMLKDHLDGIYTNRESYEWARWNIATDNSAQYKLSKEERKGNAKPMIEELKSIILGQRCRTYQNVMERGGTILERYLHVAGLSSIIENCLAFYNNVNNWRLDTVYAEWVPNPNGIHNVLRKQNVDIPAFDSLFWAWINRRAGKKNTLLFLGPSNTGKTAFIRGLMGGIPHGEIQNIASGFAFEDLVGVYMGVWEEPLIGPELAEKAKLIFEGATTSVPVKRKQPVVISGVPILMTSNHVPWKWCSNEVDALRNRMHIIRFDVGMASCSGGGETCNVCRPVKRGNSGSSASTSRPSTSLVNISSPAAGNCQLGSSGSNSECVRPGSSRCGSEFRGRSGSEFTERGDYQQPSGSGKRPDKQRSDRGRSELSSCATTSDNFGSSGHNRSGNTGERVCTGGGAEYADRASDERRGDSSVERSVASGSGVGRANKRILGSPESSDILESPVKSRARFEVSGSSRVDRSVPTTCECLRPPSLQDWSSYLAFLAQSGH